MLRIYSITLHFEGLTHKAYCLVSSSWSFCLGFSPLYPEDGFTLTSCSPAFNPQPLQPPMPVSTELSFLLKITQGLTVHVEKKYNASL